MDAEGTFASGLTYYPPVDVNDPLAKAVGLMVQHQCDVLPVVDGGRFVGVVNEGRLRDFLDGESAWSHRVGDATDFAVARVQEGTRLEDMIAIVRSNRQEVFLPVVSAEGIFKGMARPRELLAQLADVVRPPRVGGMAMLVGVHLHCGTARGGSGDLALMLTGAFLMVVVGTAWVLSFVLCWFLEPRVGVDLVPMLLGSPDVVAMGEGGVLSRVIWILPFLFFLILLRFSRLSQYHAAEHMVVHALERFEPLTEEGVARMGRVHPRCGSNLMVPVFILYLAWALWPMEYKYYFVGVIIAVVFLARNFGGVAQAVFTTRKPERRHIRKAIGAASELLRNYQRRGRRSVWLGMRVWNMGILQTLLGAFAAYGVYYAARALIEAALGV